MRRTFAEKQLLHAARSLMGLPSLPIVVVLAVAADATICFLELRFSKSWYASKEVSSHGGE